MYFCKSYVRAFSSTRIRYGQKNKRRKQAMRVDNPHLPQVKGPPTASQLALSHFDSFYSTTYKSLWPSIRLGLLSTQKYCALVNNFGDSEATVNKLNDLGCIDVGAEFMESRDRQAQYLADEETVLSAGEVEQDIMEDNVEESKPSLDPERASSRLVEPEEKILGGRDSSAAMYNFMPSTELKGMDDFVEEADYYKFYKKIRTHDVRIVTQSQISWPQTLRVFAFPRGVVERLPEPKSGILGTLNYYCMDAASLLPVLALDLKPGHRVLDMCAGPGGKSLVMLQTMFPSSLVCNDIDYKRVRRIINVLDQYLGKDGGIGNSRENILLSRRDGTNLADYESYDRVLIDAPCYSDRHSISTEADNIFVKSQVKDRLKMPEKQSELLKTGLMLLKPGGCLVYSTCTMSPIQNDGVVHMALRSLWEDTSLNFEVCDLSEAMKPFRFLVRLYGKKEGLKYGQMVVPFLPNNFGPMYFAKIRRLP